METCCQKNKSWTDDFMLENKLAHKFNVDSGIMANVINYSAIKPLKTNQNDKKKNSNYWLLLTEEKLDVLGKNYLNATYKRVTKYLEFCY